MSEADAVPSPIRTVVRLLAGLALAPPTAVLFALVTYDALWNAGLLAGGASIGSSDAAVSVGIGVGVLAVVMTGCAIPCMVWLKSRGPLTLRKVLLLGAVLGNAPFTLIVLGVVVAHPIRETLSGDIGRFWYGLPGALERMTIGVVSGMSAAAVFWLVGVRGTR